MKLKLPNITLVGIDCINIERLSLVLDICQRHIEFGQVKLLSSIPTEDKRLVSIPPVNKIDEYSVFCLESLHKYIDTNYVLIVQHDGFILNPDTWTNDFLEFDYIGAPWLVEEWLVRDFNFPPHLLRKQVVGNGGFSLRSKKLLEVSSKLYTAGKLKNSSPEDIAQCVWYRSLFKKEGITIAPVELAKKFSIEGEAYEYNDQFGFHSFVWTNISHWINKHPEYPEILAVFTKGQQIRRNFNT